MSGVAPSTAPARASNAGGVFLAFLGLGLTSFGGPIAHLGYFRTAFVERRKWLTDIEYADLVALAQFLPGPASSQVGMAIGLRRAGVLGLLAAWTAFTLPSALLMLGFAYALVPLAETLGTGWLEGLKAAAVAIVAHAVLGMGRTLAADAPRATIAVAGGVVALLVPGVLGQLGVIAAAALVGVLWLRASPSGTPASGAVSSARPAAAIACLAVFAALLVALPVLAALTGDPAVSLADRFYRAGSLVFGGGHVVLPLLEAETVAPGLVERDAFLAGYGAAQAVPGPLFTFAAYLGAVMAVPPNDVLGAVIALLAIFLPSALLVVGVLPFWERLRRFAPARRALAGVAAGVVGILGAALYDPVLTQGVLVHGANAPSALAIALCAFAALQFWRAPAWAVVIAAAILGALVLGG